MKSNALPPPAAPLRVRRFSYAPWLVGLLGGLALYLLSIGPVFRFCDGPFRLPSALNALYRPLGFIMKSHPYVAATLTWYVRRWGVEVDPHPLAIEWDASARELCKLAHDYDYGIGVTRDVVKAVQLYRKAAAQNDAPAQLALSQHYRSGQGVPADAVQALMWWLVALESGDEDFRATMGKFELSLTREERMKAESLAQAMSNKLRRK